MLIRAEFNSVRCLGETTGLKAELVAANIEASVIIRTALDTIETPAAAQRLSLQSLSLRTAN